MVDSTFAAVFFLETAFAFGFAAAAVFLEGAFALAVFLADVFGLEAVAFFLEVAFTAEVAFGTDFFFVDFLVERTGADLLTFLAFVRFAFLSTAIFKVLGEMQVGLHT